MNANEREYVEELAHECIGAAFEVSNELGVGYIEKVYENALAHELRLRGYNSKQQEELIVRYKDVVVGEYKPDLLVEEKLIVELKCASSFAPEHLAQCLNYLKGTGLSLCLLFNFQKPKVEFKRIVLDL